MVSMVGGDRWSQSNAPHISGDRSRCVPPEVVLSADGQKCSMASKGALNLSWPEQKTSLPETCHGGIMPKVQQVSKPSMVQTGGMVITSCEIASLQATLSTAMCPQLFSAYDLDPDALGRGKTAIVHRAQRRTIDCEAGNKPTLKRMNTAIGQVSTPDTLAVKVIDPAYSSTEEVLQDLQRELTMLNAVQGGPNIVEFYGFSRIRVGDSPGPSWALAMEYLDGGDLFEVAVKQTMNERCTAKVIRGLLSALAHIHALHIVHRDVKAENVLLKGDPSDPTGCNLQPVLVDFGSATYLWDTKEMQRRIGSPGCCAPEVLLGLPYNTQADVFSAGVILHFLLCGKRPFTGPDVATILQKNVKCKVKLRHERFDKVDANCKAFLLSMLDANHEVRISTSAALAYKDWPALADAGNFPVSVQVPQPPHNPAPSSCGKRRNQQTMPGQESDFPYLAKHVQSPMYQGGYGNDGFMSDPVTSGYGDDVCRKNPAPPHVLCRKNNYQDSIRAQQDPSYFEQQAQPQWPAQAAPSTPCKPDSFKHGGRKFSMPVGTSSIHQEIAPIPPRTSRPGAQPISIARSLDCNSINQSDMTSPPKPSQQNFDSGNSRNTNRRHHWCFNDPNEPSHVSGMLPPSTCRYTDSTNMDSQSGWCVSPHDVSPHEASPDEACYGSNCSDTTCTTDVPEDHSVREPLSLMSLLTSSQENVDPEQFAHERISFGEDSFTNTRPMDGFAMRTSYENYREDLDIPCK